MQYLSQQKLAGFSYVEMVFAVAMLALLAAVANPYLEKNVQRKKEIELKQNLREIRTAIDAYKNAFDQGKIAKNARDSGYPKRLEDLVYGVENIADPEKKKLRFLRRMPIDPMYRVESTAGSRQVQPAETWGVRSYDSDPDYPREGADVFDVYSKSQEVGLNGIPYAQW